MIGEFVDAICRLMNGRRSDRGEGGRFIKFQAVA
jgi:hypothetical protein